jgi:hypothetical protein
MRKAIALIGCVSLLVLLAVPAAAQGNRGKAELSTGGGAITIDYGRPSLKGRDMLSQLREGSFWRMGMNQATVLTTPVDLTFGGAKIAKGSYSLWLAKGTGDTFELVFNSQTGQWGTQHDQSKDVAKTPMTKSSLSSPVELFTIDLKQASGGGTLVMTWGTTQLSADFKTAQ